MTPHLSSKMALNIMQEIAWQLGLNPPLNDSQTVLLNQGPIKEPASRKTLPNMLQELETQLDLRPEKSWYEMQFTSQEQWQRWVQEQQANTLKLEKMLKQQADVIATIREQQVDQMSDPMIQAIADKVLKGLTEQPLYPLMLPPQLNSNNP